MVKKSKLLLALDAHKGRDYKAEYRKKQMKAAEKRKAAKKAKEEEEKAEVGILLAIGLLLFAPVLVLTDHHLEG